MLIKIARTTRTSATTTAHSDVVEESGLHHGSKDLAAAAVETSGRRSRRRTRLNKLCLRAPRSSQKFIFIPGKCVLPYTRLPVRENILLSAFPA